MNTITVNSQTLTIPNKVNRAKFPAALKLIAEKGASIASAFRTAGYKPSYAKQVTGNKKLLPVIHSAQDAFITSYMDEAAACGLNAKKTANALNTVIDTGDNKDKVSAVKAHHQVILTTMQISARSKSPQFSATLNQFVLPQSSAEGSWKGKAIEAQQDESAAARDMEAQAVPDAATPKRAIVRSEAYKAGRSQAISKGHKTRKAKALKDKIARQAQARKPR